MPLINHEAAMRKAIGDRTLALSCFSEAVITEEMCVSAVTENPFELAAVPDRLMTGTVIAAAAKGNVGILEFIPPGHRTEEKLLPAVRAEGYGPRYVRKDEWTDALMIEGLTRVNWADHLKRMDRKAIGLPVVVEAAARNPDILAELGNTLTPEATLEIARKRFAEANRRRWHDVESFLKVLPGALVTREFQQALLAITPSAVPLVPDDMQTEELWAKAGTREWLSYSSIPERFRTPKVIAATIEYDHNQMRYLPDAALGHPEVWEAAIRKAPKYIERMPRGLDIDRALAARVVRKTPRYINRIHPDAVTEELAAHVVAKDPSQLGDIPEKFRTKALCEAAVAAYPLALGGVPERFRSKAMCLKALTAAHDYSKYGVVNAIPDAYWDDPKFQKALDKMDAKNFAAAHRALPAHRITEASLLRYLRDGETRRFAYLTTVTEAHAKTPHLFANPAVWLAGARIACRDGRDLKQDFQRHEWFRRSMPEAAAADFAERVAPLSRHALRVVPDALLTEGLVTECLQANPDIALEPDAIPLAIRLKIQDQVDHAVERSKCLDLMTQIEALNAGRRTKGDLRQVAKDIVEADEALRERTGVTRGRTPGQNFPWATELVKSLARLPYDERRQVMERLIERTHELAEAPAAPVRRRA